MAWVRRHDEYDDAKEKSSCCDSSQKSDAA
jgi:hypothetical protein